MMSAEEDTELRDLVAQTLEANGVLGKIRAQLRASVFIALEEQEKVQNKTPLLNSELQKFLSTSAGCQAVSLVREFLQFFNLEYTLAVFDPEVGCAPEKLESNRRELARQLDVVETPETADLPLLSSVLRLSRDRDGRATQHRLSATQHQHSLTEDAGDGGDGLLNGVGDAKPTAAAGAEPHAAAAIPPASEDDDVDAFFDDVQKKDTSLQRKDEQKQSASADKPRDRSMTSLSGLPALSTGGRMSLMGGTSVDKEDTKAGVIDLDFDDDKYEDDFQLSNPVAQTPRSEKNATSLDDDEDIAEEIEEQLSGGEDLLKSETSVNNDLTTDRALSPMEQNATADYLEDILHL